jgi:hypothetical protein
MFQWFVAHTDTYLLYDVPNRVLFPFIEIFYSENLDSQKTITIQNEPNKTLIYVFTHQSWCTRRLRLESTVARFLEFRVRVCLPWMLCVVRYSFLRLSDHSSRGVLPSVACLNLIEKPHRGGRGPWRWIRQSVAQSDTECRFRLTSYPAL